YRAAPRPPRRRRAESSQRLRPPARHDVHRRAGARGDGTERLRLCRQRQTGASGPRPAGARPERLSVFVPTSTFGALDTARRALTVHQLGVQIAGHNVSNASTPGYSRERANLVALPDQRGVDVTSVTRLRDRFLDFSLANEQQLLGRYETQEGLLQRIQA